MRDKATFDRYAVGQLRHTIYRRLPPAAIHIEAQRAFYHDYLMLTTS